MCCRILHLVGSRQRRGAEVFALQLAQSLDRQKFESVFCIVNNGNGDGIETDGFDFHSLSSESDVARPGSVFVITYRLWKLLRATDPDIVLAHGSTTLRHMGFLRLFSSRPKVIYRNIGEASYWTNKRIVRELYRILVRRVDLVVSLNHLTRRDFVNHYGVPSERVHMIPNAVDVRPFDALEYDEARETKRKELGYKKDDAVLITVGSLSPEKNHAFLLDLLGELRQKGVQAHLLIVGDGPLRTRLESYTKNVGIASYVRMLGSRTDIPELMSAADLSVLPSLTESVPAVVIEAGLVGLPTVAFATGGLPELISDNVTGVLAPPHNPRTFAHAVLNLLDDSDARIKMGSFAKYAYRKRFNIVDIAKQYEQLFLGVLNA